MRWKKFSSFGFAKGRACVSGKTKCAKCAAGKKKLKMRVGKNFKKFRLALSVDSLVFVKLLKNCPVKVRLIVKVAKSPFFSRHCQGCTVFFTLACNWFYVYQK